MGIFNMFKKKKSESDFAEEKKGIDKPLDSLQPHQYPEEVSPRPFGKGITEPSEQLGDVEESSFPHSQQPNMNHSNRSSFDKLNIHEERRMSQPQHFQQKQDNDQLILAKLETIKAQLDFLQQKFEKIEQQLKDKEEIVKWR